MISVVLSFLFSNILQLTKTSSLLSELPFVSLAEKLSEKYYSYDNMWSNPACSFQGILDHPSWEFIPKTCGVAKMKDRIIGGQEAKPGEFPWAIKITYVMQSANDPSKWFDIIVLCSGGLINQFYILTANHCTENEPGIFLKGIIMGKGMLEVDPCPDGQCEPDGLTQYHNIEKIIQYNSQAKPGQHDIALLKLATPAQFNDYVQPACIPRGDFLEHPSIYLKQGEQLTVSGFGSIDGTDHMVTSKNHIMFVHLSIQPLEKCSSPQFTKFKNIDTSLICAGDPPFRDTCVGDSGSPVVVPLSVKGPPRNYLVGIVSFGAANCGETYALYVNVACYVKWILDNVEM